MKVYRSEEVEEGLKSQGRIYLCGDLESPAPIKCIQTDGYEIGITEYKEFTCDKAHCHTENLEYNYVLTGEVKVFVFSENKEYRFGPGDLYILEPDMPYITKAAANTRVIFSKVPGGNDKVLVPEKEMLVKIWMKSWDTEIENA